MAPRKRAAVDDSSSDEEVNVEKVVETKQMLDKVPPPRERSLDLNLRFHQWPTLIES